MKVLKHLYNNLWIYTTLLLFIFVVLIKILERYNLEFRLYIQATIIATIVIGYILSLIILYKKADKDIKHAVKVLLAIILIYLIIGRKLVTALYLYKLIFMNWYTSEEVYTINNAKYIVHINNQYDSANPSTNISIYEYVNCFVYKTPHVFYDTIDGNYNSIKEIDNYHLISHNIFLIIMEREQNEKENYCYFIYNNIINYNRYNCKFTCNK